jgi:predicted GIY-YIG superfamily endonuclease
MKYVYILRSVRWPERRYVGITSDLPIRLAAHNAGKSVYTNKFRPWKVETYVAFSDQFLAERFEEYLKHGSGWAFATRHFIAG